MYKMPAITVTFPEIPTKMMTIRTRERPIPRDVGSSSQGILWAVVAFEAVYRRLVEQLQLQDRKSRAMKYALRCMTGEITPSLLFCCDMARHVKNQAVFTVFLDSVIP